jgi:hypothetical protein
VRVCEGWIAKAVATARLMTTSLTSEPAGKS